jgi:hypothetical protein
MNGSRPSMKKVSRPALRSSPLAIPMMVTSRGKLISANTAFNQQHIGPVRHPGCVIFRVDLTFGGKPRKAPGQNFAHHPEIVAGCEVLGFDIERPVVLFGKAIHSRHDHRSDGICALDVRIIVNFDAARGFFQTERFSHGFEQLSLARGV